MVDNGHASFGGNPNMEPDNEKKAVRISTRRMIDKDEEDKTWSEKLTEEIEASNDEEAKQIWAMLLQAEKLKADITKEQVADLAHEVRYAKVSPKFREGFERMIRILNKRVERSISENFGSLIKHLREEKGYSLKEMEELTGVSASYIHRIEKGERKAPSLKIIEKLAEVLDQDVYDLLEVAHSGSEEDLPTIEQLILSNNFMIGYRRATREIKLQLVELISKINNARWSESERFKEAMEISEQITRYKNALNKK